MTASVGAVGTQPAAADSVTVTVTKVATETSATAVSRTASTKTASAAKAVSKRKVKLSRAALQRTKARRAVSAAESHIGAPYRWGATGPRAFDCSGLVQYAWRKAGVRLPRTTWSIRGAVKKKVAWGHFKPGDLIFSSGGGHVGMYVGHGKMIHAPHTGARVRIDKLDSYRRRTFAGAVRPGA
ncbi:C40 family peptidase [Microbispora corallina]|uniref:C40 family peptidase n=1 Tax=Microbispora corallina TaxID=83302 RepID=UPI001EF1FE3C|nr:C40 family peptidase [Microbispora corallina]